jgi:hypothetical protein
MPQEWLERRKLFPFKEAFENKETIHPTYSIDIDAEINFEIQN